MLLSTAILVSVITSIASALPSPVANPEASPAELVPRACSTLGPSPIDVLEKSDPNNPHDGPVFQLDRTGSSGSYTNDNITVLTFNYIPAGATGCMLQVEFPPLTQPNQIASGTATQANVWTVAPDPNGVSTYNNPPVRNQFVSTLIFPTTTSTEIYKTILYSNTCSPTMSFLFELSTWQQGTGHVQFFNSLGGKQGLQPIGFSMIFDC